MGTATVFLHERTSPAGHRRIVGVDVFGYDVVAPAPTARVIRLMWGIYHPSSRPQTARADNEWHWYIDCRPEDRLRLFAGQPDPSDPSHFTIGYDYNGAPGVIDVHLQDDDTLRLVPDRGTGGGPDPRGGWSPFSNRP